MVNLDSKIYVAGHEGMVGSSCWRLLKQKGYKNLIGRSRVELNLRDQNSVKEFFSKEKPDVVIDAAAKVGGIMANNSYPYEFLMENLQIQNNLIEFSFSSNVKKFLFLGSSCIYPKLATQPIKEGSLLSGRLETTNEGYAIAKIAGLKSCEYINRQYGRDFISLMPTNLYGPNDNFDLTTSHVIPAMIRKFHEAKSLLSDVSLWGTGTPMREFLHVDDLARAVFHLFRQESKDTLYNVGSGKDISIHDLALIVQNVVGHKGKVVWDKSNPDGTPKKLLDISKISKSGWEPSIELEIGIHKVYQWYLQSNYNV